MHTEAPLDAPTMAEPETGASPPPHLSPHLSPRLKFREIFSYGVADLGQISLMQLSSIYLLYFYTDLLYVGAGIVGTVFLLSRLWDALNDPLMGFIVDRTYTRFGRCRPYLIPGSIVLTLSTLAIFVDPGLEGGALLLYIVVTYNLFNMAFTATNLPMTAQLPLMTDVNSDRVRLSSVRAFFQSCAYAGVPIVAEALFGILGERDDAGTYLRLTLIFGLFCIVVFIDTFRHTRERVYLKPERIAWRGLGKVFGERRYWLMLLLSNILLSTALLARTSAAIYHFQYYLQDMRWFGVFMTLSSIAMIPLSFVAAPIAERIGKRNFALAGTVVGILGNLLILWRPLDIAALLSGSFLSGFSIAAFICVLFAMEGDLADEAETRTGVRAQGIITSVIALGYKVALGLGAGSVGWLLGAAGYDATLPLQPEAVGAAIDAAFIWLPLGGTVLGAVTLLCYGLDDQLPAIHASLRGRQQPA